MKDKLTETSFVLQKRRDNEDYNNELAGREAGRQSRFLGDERRDGEHRRRQREQQAVQARITELLSDPI